MAYAGHNQPERRPIVIGVSATLHDERRFLAKVLDVPPTVPHHEARRRVVKPQPGEWEATEGRERYLFLYPRRVWPTPRKPNDRVNDSTSTWAAATSTGSTSPGPPPSTARSTSAC